MKLVKFPSTKNFRSMNEFIFKCVVNNLSICTNTNLFYIIITLKSYLLHFSIPDQEEEVNLEPLFVSRNISIAPTFSMQDCVSGILISYEKTNSELLLEKHRMIVARPRVYKTFSCIPRNHKSFLALTERINTTKQA